MDSAGILEELKNDIQSSFCIVREEDLLGDCYYEEYLFYIPETTSFYKQIVDWNRFISESLRRGITYEKVTDTEATVCVESRLEQGMDD